MEEVIIEPVNLESVMVIEELARITWPIAYAEILSKEQLEYMLSKFYNATTLKERMNTNSVFYLIKELDKPLGFMELGFNEEQGKCKLHKLYVLPEEQGKHLGQKLIAYAIAVCKKEQQRSLYLNVNRHNKALDFYKKLGFEILLSEDIDIGNGYYMNDYVLQINFD